MGRGPPPRGPPRGFPRGGPRGRGPPRGFPRGPRGPGRFGPPRGPRGFPRGPRGAFRGMPSRGAPRPRGRPGFRPPRGRPRFGPPRGGPRMALGAARPFGQTNTYGTLSLRCVGGEGLPAQNSGLYVRFTVGPSEQITSVRQQGGQPKWGDNFKFKVTNEIKMTVECFEKVKLSQDKLIGSTTVNLQTWISARTYKGKLDLVDTQNSSAGRVEVEATYELAGQRAPLNLPQRKGAAKQPSAPKDEPARDPNGRFTD